MLRVASADGTAVAVHVDGPEDAPVAAFLHGVVLSAATWDFLVEEVAATHRVVRVDLRGHGDSGRAPGHYDLAGFVADAEAALEAVGGAALLVGHSLGGVTAAALAQRRPDLVGALLLEDPALGLAEPVTGPPTGPLLDLFRVIRRRAPQLQADGVAPAELAPRLEQARTPFGEPAGERYESDALLAWARGQLQLDVRVLDPIIDPPPVHLGPAFDLATPIPVPTHVLAADLAAPNRVTGRHHEAGLLATSPGLVFERLPGGGHNLHDERAQRPVFLDRLRAMLHTQAP